MNKVLLTGATGFLGRNIISELSSNQIITLGRNKANIVCDLAKEIPNLTDSVDVVIHAAGKAHIVPKTKAEKIDFFDVNVKGTKNLLLALEQLAVKPQSFVFISSVSVYGLGSGLAVDEKYPLNAVEPYGLSKIQAEELVKNWCKKNNIICSILRLPLLVGDNPPGNLGAMIKGIKTGRYFRIGKGTARKSMVLVKDVVKLIPSLAEIGGIYNLTDRLHPSFAEIEDVLSAKFNKKLIKLPKTIVFLIAKCGDMINFIVRKRIFPMDSRAFDKITKTLIFNDDLACQELGWKPQSTLDFIQKQLK